MRGERGDGRGKHNKRRRGASDAARRWQQIKAEDGSCGLDCTCCLTMSNSLVLHLSSCSRFIFFDLLRNLKSSWRMASCTCASWPGVASMVMTR